MTLLGQKESHEELVRRNLHANVELVPFYREGGRTTVKSRLVDPAYVKKLIEVAYLSDEALAGARAGGPERLGRAEDRATTTP